MAQNIVEKIKSHLEEIDTIDTIRIITKPKPYGKKYNPIKTRLNYESNKEKMKQYNKEYREKKKEYFKAYRELNKERRQLYDLKYNAKRRITSILAKNKEIA